VVQGERGLNVLTEMAQPYRHDSEAEKVVTAIPSKQSSIKSFFALNTKGLSTPISSGTKGKSADPKPRVKNASRATTQQTAKPFSRESGLQSFEHLYRSKTA
jgi:hypothetical protein